MIVYSAAHRQRVGAVDCSRVTHVAAYENYGLYVVEIILGDWPGFCSTTVEWVHFMALSFSKPVTCVLQI